MLFLCLLFSMGCTKIVYLEKETPPGQVPSAPEAVSIQSPTPIVPPTQVGEESKKDQIFSENRNVMQAEVGRESSNLELSLGTIQRFKRSYETKKSPRIAVFLNRELSDEVREWATDSRLVLSEDYSKTKQVGKQETEKTKITEGVSGYSQTHIETSGRPALKEKWMWAFEDGFIQPLLQANAKLVDRGTIMRLTAAVSSQDKNTYAPLEVKKVEMDALKGYADIFVEILISRSPSSLYGYEFKASAKEVNTGIILANVTSLRWRPEDRKQRKVYATSHDYEVVDTIQIPPVEDISSDLAIDLMNALARVWGE